MDTSTFILTSLIIVLLPGTGVIYTISTGLTRGKKSSIIAAIGCTLGIIPHLIVSISLSSLLLKMNSQSFFILKILGGLYLLYLGIGMINSKADLDISFNNAATVKEHNNITRASNKPENNTATAENYDSTTSINKNKSTNNLFTIVTRGILINLLNPKLTLFFFSFLPQYVSTNSDSYIKTALLLGLVFMFITLIVFIGYGLLAGFMKSFLVNSPKRVKSIQNVFGIIFIIFAVKLSLSSM